MSSWSSRVYSPCFEHRGPFCNTIFVTVPSPNFLLQGTEASFVTWGFKQHTALKGQLSCGLG